MSTTITLPSGAGVTRFTTGGDRGLRFWVHDPKSGNSVELTIEDTRMLRDFALRLTVGGPGDFEESDDE